MITNHSNRDVTVNVTAQKAADADANISLTVEDDNNDTDNTLANGVVNDVDGAAKMTATVSISGNPTSNYADYTTVGSITVAITPLNSMANTYTTGN